MVLAVCSCVTEGDAGSPRSRFSGNVLDGGRSGYRLAAGHSRARRLPVVVFNKRLASATDVGQMNPDEMSRFA